MATANTTVQYITADGKLTPAGFAFFRALTTGTLTAAQMPAFTGDVTSPGASLALTIANDAVTFAKMQNITDARLLGRNAGTAGDAQEITLGTNLSFTGTTLNASSAGLADGDKGDVIVSVGGTVWAIDYVAINPTIAPVFANVTSKPTTLSGYGITDGQPLDGDLTTIAALVATTDSFLQSKASAWAARTVAQVKVDLGLTGTNSGDQTITLTSDITGSGVGSFAATLATVNATTGSFGLAASVAQFTTNAKGLITAAANVAISITSAAISDLTTAIVTIAGTQNITGAKTFTNATNVVGNSTAASTVGIATGITVSGSTKAVSIGTLGAAGSTTTITVGPVAGAGAGTVAISTGVTAFTMGGATLIYKQAATTAKSALATLTAAEVLAGIIEYSGLVASLTMPTGATLDAGIPTVMGTDQAFMFSVIDIGTGAVTMVANTGVTIVGAAMVAVGASGRFMCRRTAAATYILYRIA